MFLLVPLIESVCIVCRDGPVLILVGVLCAGSSQNRDTLGLGHRTRSLSAQQDMIMGVQDPSLYNTTLKVSTVTPFVSDTSMISC